MLHRYIVGGFLLIIYTNSDLFCALSWVYLNGFNGGVFINNVICPAVVNLMSDQTNLLEHRGVVASEKERIQKEIEEFEAKYFSSVGISERILQEAYAVSKLKRVFENKDYD